MTIESNINAVTQSIYSTNNQELLDGHKQAFALSSNQWAGFRQWIGVGRKVKKGAKGCQILMVCEKKTDVKQEGEEEKKRQVVKSLYVFNKEHTEALEQRSE